MMWAPMASQLLRVSISLSLEPIENPEKLRQETTGKRVIFQGPVELRYSGYRQSFTLTACGSPSRSTSC
jgi:hypothetical protein